MIKACSVDRIQQEQDKEDRCRLLMINPSNQMMFHNGIGAVPTCSAVDNKIGS